MEPALYDMVKYPGPDCSDFFNPDFLAWLRDRLTVDELMIFRCGMQAIDGGVVVRDWQMVNGPKDLPLPFHASSPDEIINRQALPYFERQAQAFNPPVLMFKMQFWKTPDGLQVVCPLILHQPQKKRK